MTYYLTMRDDQASETIAIDTAEKKTIVAACREWVDQGEWGAAGARISVDWSLADEERSVLKTGSVTVDVEPDHDALIHAAGGSVHCDHQWTAEGEGGCADNPGVWQTGGTSLAIATHCRLCGLHRIEHHTGSQYNPGEHDSVEYEQPATWCGECRRETCDCQVSQ